MNSNKFYPGQLVRFNPDGVPGYIDDDEINEADIALVVAIKLKHYGQLVMVLFDGKLDEYHDGWFVEL